MTSFPNQNKKGRFVARPFSPFQVTQRFLHALEASSQSLDDDHQPHTVQSKSDTAHLETKLESAFRASSNYLDVKSHTQRTPYKTVKRYPRIAANKIKVLTAIAFILLLLIGYQSLWT